MPATATIGDVAELIAATDLLGNASRPQIQLGQLEWFQGRAGFRALGPDDARVLTHDKTLDSQRLVLQPEKSPGAHADTQEAIDRRLCSEVQLMAWRAGPAQA